MGKVLDMPGGSAFRKAVDNVRANVDGKTAAQIRALGLNPDDLPIDTKINGQPIGNAVRNQKVWKPKAMNQTEAAFARHLDWMKSVGQILEWRFEDITLRLSGQDPQTHRSMKYTPDFFVLVEVMERPWMIEIKGKHIWDDARVKFRQARDAYDLVFRFTMIQKDGAAWRTILGESSQFISFRSDP